MAASIHEGAQEYGRSSSFDDVLPLKNDILDLRHWLSAAVLHIKTCEATNLDLQRELALLRSGESAMNELDERILKQREEEKEHLHMQQRRAEDRVKSLEIEMADSSRRILKLQEEGEEKTKQLHMQQRRGEDRVKSLEREMTDCSRRYEGELTSLVNERHTLVERVALLEAVNATLKVSNEELHTHCWHLEFRALQQ